MYKFTSLYTAISKVNMAVGFCFLGMDQSSEKFCTPVLMVYCVASTIPSIYTVVCNMVVYYTIGPYDIQRHGLTTIAIVTAFDTFHYLFHREEFTRLLRDFDDITENLVDLKFVVDRDMKRLLNRGRKFNTCMKYFVMCMPLQVVCAAFFSYFMHYVHGQNFLFLEVPYSVESELMFQVTTVLQTSAGLYACLKTTSSWAVMFLLLYHVTFYLKTLGNCFENFNSVDKNQQLRHNSSVTFGADNYFRLRKWFKLHQKIIR